MYFFFFYKIKKNPTRKKQNPKTQHTKTTPIYGIGSNIFKLAGSVILYGIVAAWFFGMIRYLLGGRI